MRLTGRLVGADDDEHVERAAGSGRQRGAQCVAVPRIELFPCEPVGRGEDDGVVLDADRLGLIEPCPQRGGGEILLEAEPMTGGLILALDDSEDGAGSSRNSSESRGNKTKKSPRKRAAKTTRKMPQSRPKKAAGNKPGTKNRKGGPRRQR